MVTFPLLTSFSSFSENRCSEKRPLKSQLWWMFFSLYLDIVELKALGPLGPLGPKMMKFSKKLILLFYLEFLNEKISALDFEIVSMKAILGISIKLFVMRLHS